MRRAGFDYAGWLGAGCLIGSDWLRQPRFKATTFRKERRIADVGLVFLWKFGLSLGAVDWRKAGQANRGV
jgi:hypothetical protein